MPTLFTSRLKQNRPKRQGKNMSAVRIGPYTLPNQLILAPMAGVTDRPFRQLCRRGAQAWWWPRC